MRCTVPFFVKTLNSSRMVKQILGYSTMCGHATIALGQFLVDMQDLKVFPRRKQLKFNHESNTVQVNLSCPMWTD